MALEGTLQDFSLADIFQLIGLQRKTGILTLAGQEDTVSILFDEGRIVGAESEAKHLEDRLGHVLLKTGKLNSGALNRILRIQKETGQRIGTILLRENAITRADLVRALQLQVTQILYRLFRWSDGHYHFGQSAQVEYDRHCFEPIPVEDILMEGLRILDEWPLIEKRVRSFSLVYAQADPSRRVEAHEGDDDEDLGSSIDALLGVEVEEAGGDDGATPGDEAQDGAHERVTVSSHEVVVYRLVNGRNTVQEIIDRSDLGEFETCKALFQLLEKDLIQESSGPRSAAPARRSISATADRAAAFALAVSLAGVALLSGFLSARHLETPFLERAIVPFFPGSGNQHLRMASSQNRIARLEFALRVFALHRGRLPVTLDELVSTGLVTEDDLVDPWGSRYAYVLSRRSFQIRGVDGAGLEHPALILTGRIPGTDTAAPEQGRLRP